MWGGWKYSQHHTTKAKAQISGQQDILPLDLFESFHFSCAAKLRHIHRIRIIKGEYRSLGCIVF